MFCRMCESRKKLEILFVSYYNKFGTVIPFSVLPDSGSKWIKTNEKESIIERGMHMIDNAIKLVNKTVRNIFYSLTITVKTPFIDFSFAPLIFY